MRARAFARAVAIAAVTVCFSSDVLRAQNPTPGPTGPAVSFLDPPAGGRGGGGYGSFPGGSDDPGDTPPCWGAPFCGNRITGISSSQKGVVVWTQNLPYTPSGPFTVAESSGGGLPVGSRGGVVSVAIDSQDNLWALQRAPVGEPQLRKFGPDHELLFALGDDVISHHVKAHGMKVDAQDNVYIIDEAQAVIRKISPDGEVLATIGEPGRRGDWNEEEGQRLLWEPVMVDFAPNGNMFIFMGHHNESPNDADGPDPWNRVGAARVLVLDSDLNYVTQWYGNSGGPGKFTGAHGGAVDPVTGLVWIGDREQYRIVIYQPDGTFVRTIQTKNLVCSIYFDRFGGVWQGAGLDGQLLKIDRDANVIGAMGFKGNDVGGWCESSYLTMDSEGNIYSGDTCRARITKWTPDN